MNILVTVIYLKAFPFQLVFVPKSRDECLINKSEGISQVKIFKFYSE